MVDNRRYTVVETSKGESTMTTVVAGNVVRAYKKAIQALYGDTPLSEVPKETNLEIEKVEEKKEQWVEVDE